MAYQRYYVNTIAQPSGEHEVHVDDNTCPYPPSLANRLDLGLHETCASASAKARAYYSNVDGCYWCNRLCHTR